MALSLRPYLAATLALMIIILIAGDGSVDGWVIEIASKGHRSVHFSSRAANGCFNINQQVQNEGVSKFKFCTNQKYNCQIHFFAGAGCTGKDLGNNGGPGNSWTKDPVSKAGSTMKSFLISGCNSDWIFGEDKSKLGDC